MTGMLFCIKSLVLFIFIIFIFSVNSFGKIIGIPLDQYEVTSNNTNTQVYGIKNYYFSSLNKFCNKYNVGIIFLPYDQSQITNYTKIIDGLLIPGDRWDINPKLYHSTLNIKTILAPNEDRVNFEMALIKAMMKQKKPILGICHGMQLINVINGGTLIQDIPSQIISPLKHNDSYDDIAHGVFIDNNSKLAKILFGSDKIINSIKINSSHHQSIKKIGNGLRVVGKASDGVIEAIEGTDVSYLIGIQWHPEKILTKYDEKIIDNFCKIVSEYK